MNGMNSVEVTLARVLNVLVTDDTALLTIGAVPVNPTISKPGERDFYTFTLASPARLVMDTQFDGFTTNAFVSVILLLTFGSAVFLRH